MNEPDKYTRATGRSLSEWAELLRSSHPGIEERSHREIAQAAGELGASEWWAQGIAVDFERMIGRRKIGESSDGSIRVSASKTLAGEWTSTFQDFVNYLHAYPEELPAELAGQPRVTETEKWRYWKAKFTDGTSASINCSDASKNGRQKVRFAVEHDGLADLELRPALKEHWRAAFGSFARQRE